jgi:hypothetical protein
MIVISEYSPQLKPSASLNDLRTMSDTARMLNIPVYYIPQNFDEISVEEEKNILSLAEIAAQRIKTPYIAIDIGQKTTGEWIVLEAGDAQFSGICQISPLLLWQKIIEKTSNFSVI